MKIGIVGSGMVAQSQANKLLEAGNEVMISSRTPDKAKENRMGKLPSVNEWVSAQTAMGRKAKGGSFAQAVKFGEVVINCTEGVHSLEALATADRNDLKGKILVDIANPLVFAGGPSPNIEYCNTESLGERVQAAYPQTRVVKTLNTVNAYVQTNPSLVPGEHDMFLCGNDAGAKEWVTDTMLRKWFGWKNVIDLGDISCARATEMYLPLWMRLMGALDTPNFNVHIAKAKK